ncbi:MAG: hypothetical protein ORN21_01875, partial [Methylophilaceae bacterium]|nr:hypothetical protein [Methylophilaceae bacterium]
MTDFVIGAPSFNSNRGRSYVIFGKTNTSAIQLTAIANGIGGFVINGESASDQAGFSVSAAGDINGDGLADLLIAANTASITASGTEGRVYVVFGKTNISSIELSQVGLGKGGFVIEGANIGDNLGSSVSAAGDINGDGFADLLVGAKAANAGGGSTYVILGGVQYATVAYVQGSGTVAGGLYDELIVGSNSADTLTGGGGTDRFFAGAGNDTIVLTASDVSKLVSTSTVTGALATVDGGSGIDTIRFSGGGVLNLAAIAGVASAEPQAKGRISSIEHIDYRSDTAANVLIVSTQSVLNIATMNSFNTGNGWSNVGVGSAFSSLMSTHQLWVDGLNNDSVNLNQLAWIKTNAVSKDGLFYDVWNARDSAAQLIINQDISIVNVDTIDARPRTFDRLLLGNISTRG